MAEKKQLRIGMIGAGGIASAMHLPGWSKIDEAEVVAVADVSQKQLDAVKNGFGITKTYHDFTEMLANENLDAVDICAPNKIHPPAALAALEAGCHVLCEKPLAVSTDDVRRIGKSADAKGLKLMTAQHMRYTSSAMAIRNWVEDNRLGKVYHAKVFATRQARLPISPGFINSELSGGGPCMDIGVHALDMAMWLMDFPTPSRVMGTSKVNFARGYKIPGAWGEWDRNLFSVEDFAAGFIKFRNGATLSIETSWLGHHLEEESFSCELLGMKGGVRWPSTEFCATSNGSFMNGKLKIPASSDVPHHAEIRDFVDCILNDTPSPVPWTETIKVIAILEGIYASQKTGRNVVIAGKSVPK